MIYEFPESDEPIRQGDIFYPLPLVSVVLDDIPVLGEDGAPERKRWEETGDNVVATLPIEKTWGIVATQDCDSVRAPAISFFVVKEYSSAMKNDPPRNARGWMRAITKELRKSPKLFYLPADPKVGFPGKMLVLFESVLQLPRDAIESRRATHRKGRLIADADEHYRESIAQFFRRYPYNEWYPLNRSEFGEYSRDNNGGPFKRYPWQ